MREGGQEEGEREKRKRGEEEGEDRRGEGGREGGRKKVWKSGDGVKERW